MDSKLSLVLLLLFFIGCRNAQKETQKQELTYFDLKNYFGKEVIRLTRAAPQVTKTVAINGSAETKKMKIANWKGELAVFSDADMNRTSWKGFFKVNKSLNDITYTSANEKVPVKEVRIHYRAGKLHGITLLIKNSNALYTSADTLTYFPDSLYQIKKTQNIKLLDSKKYQVTGKF